MELKNRNEMDANFKWDLTHIYEDKQAWEQAYSEAEELIGKIDSLKGTLGDSAESLKKAMDTVFEAAEKAELVAVYAFLIKSGDNGDPEYQDMESRGDNLFVKLNMAMSFIDPEILSIPEQRLHEFMQHEGLKTYRHYIEDVDRAREHTLDAERERMLAMLGEAADSPKSAFEMLESVDMSFPTIIDEAGNEAPLTHGNFGVYRESPIRRVREEAFLKYFGEFKRYLNTFAATYGGAVKFDNYFASVRKFESACERALFGNNVPVSVYDSLIEAIHGALPTMKQYLNLRKKTLKLDEIDMFDLYTPMVSDIEYEMPFAAAKKLVKDALKPLGEDYQKLLDRAYSEGWIDVYENKGKTTGAYSCGVYGVHPYVLLNYTDTLDDAFTLAHELGHAMHSFLSSKENDFANHEYRIMVAEVASTVNEVLLTKHLLKTETDPKRRAYILNHFLEGFRTTVFRQTLFAEFERKAHEMNMAGEPLTAQSLSEVYKGLVSLYYEGANINDILAMEWAYIPHFYRGFYVYQYATGFSSAVTIATNIIETGDASNYLKFLSTGGSDYPLNELKIAGVDLTKPDAVAKAMKVFQDSLDELGELLNKIG